MIKRKRKVIAAVLIAATVCASGTFAYFNAKVDFSEGNVFNGKSSISITNGKVEIGARVGETELEGATWTYDVARLSTDEDLASGTRLSESAKTAITNMLGTSFSTTSSALNAGFNTNASTISNTEVSDGTTYVLKNQSPDITGFTKTEKESLKIADGIFRMNIGAPLTEAVANARPGDAIVLGDSSDKTKQGLVVENTSNLVTNIRIRLVKTDDALEQFLALKEAGWVLYINGKNVTKDITDTSSIDTVNEAIEKVYLAVAPNTNKSTIENSGNTTAGAEAKFEVRLELPLATTNLYQEKTATTTSNNSGFDIRKIFEIVATQENNTGWNEDGSESNPITTNSAVRNNE